MTLRAIVNRVARRAFARIGPGGNGMKELEIPLVDLFLNVVSPLVAVDAEHLIFMALRAHGRVLFRI